MKRTLAKICCIAIAVLMIVPTFVSMVSAADELVNIYDASNTTVGTPPTTIAASGSGNANYYCSAPIEVKAGDVITFGPCLVDQGYYLTTYDADGNRKIAQVKYADCTQVDVVRDNSVIVKWTVPEGSAYIRFAVAQLFVDNTLATKNQEFNTADYIAYMDNKGADISYFNGVNASEPLVNLFPTSDSVFAGRGSSSGDVATADYMTCDYIPVQEGDVIYFGAAASAQSYQLVLYDADKKATTQINYKYMVNVDTIDDTHVIYAYRMRPGTAYVRFVAAADVYNNGQQLVTINQPFNAEGYNNFLNPPETTEPAPETTEPAPETTEPAPETTEPAPETTEPAPETTAPESSSDTGDASLIFAFVAAVSVIGVAIVAKRREN